MAIYNTPNPQLDAKSIIILADVQAMRTHFEHPELLNESIYDVAIDNLSVNALRHNPTIKTEVKQYGYDDISYGFLGYPVSQAAEDTAQVKY